MRRVGLIGHGAIGSVVAAELRSGSVAGCELAGVLVRSPRAGVPMPVDGIDELVDRSDLVVEAAGHAAVALHGRRVLASGTDLLVVSVGALIDADLRIAPDAAPGGGRLLLSAGAIGGLGLLRAAVRLGELHRVRLTTTKSPAALVRESTERSVLDELRTSDRPVPVFEGTARQAVARFPTSINVAATLALATVGLDRTEVRILADRSAERVRHSIDVDADAGRYQLRIENTPSPNPRTSAITPYNVLRALGDLSDATVIGL